MSQSTVLRKAAQRAAADATAESAKDQGMNSAEAKKKKPNNYPSKAGAIKKKTSSRDGKGGGKGAGAKSNGGRGKGGGKGSGGDKGRSGKRGKKGGRAK
eukprot:SAG31_NODE_12940_length_905_cov_1.256824_1_plen_99_part_00